MYMSFDPNGVLGTHCCRLHVSRGGGNPGSRRRHLKITPTNGVPLNPLLVSGGGRWMLSFTLHTFLPWKRRREGNKRRKEGENNCERKEDWHIA